MKGAVEVLSRAMAFELGRAGLPSMLLRRAPLPPISAVVNKRIAENTARGRAGVPDDLGPVIASLLSEENRWVNAQRIEVAGGAI
jgi:NAD(P)-dependent dehydrogenase (short-subunit alcohol dehydrogenase family)